MNDGWWLLSVVKTRSVVQGKSGLLLEWMIHGVRVKRLLLCFSKWFNFCVSISHFVVIKLGLTERRLRFGISELVIGCDGTIIVRTTNKKLFNFKRFSETHSIFVLGVYPQKGYGAWTWGYWHSQRFPFV